MAKSIHSVIQGIIWSLVGAAAIIISMAAAASAQSLSPFQPAQKRQLTPEEIEKQKKLDEAYKATINKLPEHKTADPWGTVRQSPVQSTKTKQQ